MDRLPAPGNVDPLRGVFMGVILGFYWGNLGIMEKKMEATIYCLRFRPGNVDP